ncbi:peptidase [Larkinella punicea]|uniref:Peptidase n=2 Tax=Larkinella punicea TaxID=2315727 RepID=A0A368JQI2_9BACT|nr:peptidase [Larkinella punicea]
MNAIESYFAQADVNLAQALANSTSPFTIEVRFLGGLTENQKNAFKAAADRWSSVIVGDLPTIKVDGENIDDVLILAEGSDIDGSGGILGQAGPTHLRPANAGVAAFLPAKGRMTFDKADLENMEKNGSLTHVITHEMGHVLGIGTIWTKKGLLKGAGTTNPTFTGALAMFEYGQLKGTGPAPVPVENQHGPGTQDSHWREPIFRNELMTGFIDMGNNPLSRVTVGSLKDMGYVVDMNAAEAYTLPNLLQLAESGELIAAEDSLELGTMLSIIPTVLPEDSLQ